MSKGNKNAEQFENEVWRLDNPEIAAKGLARRQGQLQEGKGKRAKRDYSDKGEHEWYLISAYAYKCSKCEIIKSVLFGDPVKHTENSTRYLLDPDKRQWQEPKCTWKGRAAR